MDVNTRFVYILMDPRLLMIIAGQTNSLTTATLVLDGEQISRSGLRLQHSSKACRGAFIPLHSPLFLYLHVALHTLTKGIGVSNSSKGTAF